MQFAPEPFRERTTGAPDQLFDSLETQFAQAVDIGGRQAERCDGQERDRLSVRSGFNRDGPPGGDMAGGRMRAAGRVRDRNLQAEAEGRDAAMKILEQGSLAAEDGRAARDVEPEPVGRIGRDNRRIACACPEGEAPQPVEIGLGFRVDDIELGRESPRFRDRHACLNTKHMGLAARRRDDTPAMVGNRGDERAGRGAAVRLRLAHLPAQPVGRPVRQEERYDPSHRSPPRSSCADCRLARARARRASARVRSRGCRDPRSDSP